jgi:hypothetical protein
MPRKTSMPSPSYVSRDVWVLGDSHRHSSEMTLAAS